MSGSSNAEPETAAPTEHRGWLEVWWPRAKTAAKGITGLAGLGAAIVAIFAWFPLAQDAVWPELEEYETLSSLYAGASVSLFDGELGPPSIVEVLPGEAGLTERLYVKKDYIVGTLATSEGDTRLYSVLSCNPSFKPTFQFFDSRIILQDKPLSAQMSSERPPSHLYYVAPGTVSSQLLFFELITATSNATDRRGSGYGVNGVCGELPTTSNPAGSSVLDYFGPPDQAPREIQDYRAKTPVNFYVEFRDVDLAEEARGSFVLPFVYVTPNHSELPPGWPKS